MLDSLKEGKGLLCLWFGQEGVCPTCTQKISKESGWNIYHIQKIVDGGNETMASLVLLHPNCHNQVHNQGLEVHKPRLLKKAFRDA